MCVHLMKGLRAATTQSAHAERTAEAANDDALTAELACAAAQPTSKEDSSAFATQDTENSNQ